MVKSEFFLWAKKNEWNVNFNLRKTDLPDNIKSRYNIPKQWYDFISEFDVCENRAATKWFFTANDYLPHEEGFQWNEFELQSLECDNNKSDIVSFWNKHIPVFMSVDGEYSYYAVNTENGKVVYGYGPEYEEAMIVAENFDDFIMKTISGEIIL